jgi:methylase of polypeptide subunit release factors
VPANDLAVRLLGEPRQGALRSSLGRALTLFNRTTGRARYDRLHLERVRGTPILILPTVFNPRVLRSGAFFAETIADHRLGEGGDVLDLGTGSGICAVFAARHARRVIAVDINRAAVRCAGINASINGVAERIECRHGDLFAPVAADRFDTVFFNPPFYLGAPENDRDIAWRSLDIAGRFAAGLEAQLSPRGRAYLLLSTLGDACARFLEELAGAGFTLSVHVVRRYINERCTIVEVTRSETRSAGG